MASPELLRALLLHEDARGALTVQHLAADALAALVNAGQLSLVCEWLGRALDDFLRYLSAGRGKIGSYAEFIAQISSLGKKAVQKQYFLEKKLSEYYFNTVTQMLLSIDLILGEIGRAHV